MKVRRVTATAAHRPREQCAIFSPTKDAGAIPKDGARMFQRLRSIDLAADYWNVMNSGEGSSFTTCSRVSMGWSFL